MAVLRTDLKLLVEIAISQNGLQRPPGPGLF
jgi:hypothetical protein